MSANLAASHCPGMLVGVTGADAEARSLREALMQDHVGTDHLVPDASRPTTVKTRLLAQNQQIVRLDREVRSPIDGQVEDEVLSRIGDCLPKSSACILSDYGKGVVTTRVASETISRCRSLGIPVLIDPKSLGLPFCRGATLVKPNKQEAERLAGREILDEPSFLEVGEFLASALGGAAVLVTRGGLGMTLFRQGREPHHAATPVRNVFDVTGAGDTVIALCGIGLACGLSLKESVELASQAAALAVGKLGTSTVSVAEVRAAMAAAGLSRGGDPP